MQKLNPHIQKLKPIIATLPNKPGVYQFLDAKAKIIYIGKAKSLKKRVSSYFNKDSGVSGKTSVMVQKIADIQHIIVNTELDALLLENNLIKKYQPRYNVLLKDDKTFPWICIKNERFPRVFPTRNVIRDGSEFFGPYASVRMMNTLLDLIRQLYKLRTCKHLLSKKNIDAGKFKVCLEYHLGNCLGACENKEKEDDYNQTINEIKLIIKGNISQVKNQLKYLMEMYADKLEFEKAQAIKEKIELLKWYQSKSMVVNPKIHNVDVFSIITDNEAGYVNYMKVVDGAIVQAHTVEMKKKLDETKEKDIYKSYLNNREEATSNIGDLLREEMMNLKSQDSSEDQESIDGSESETDEQDEKPEGPESA